MINEKHYTLALTLKHWHQFLAVSNFHERRKLMNFYCILSKGSIRLQKMSYSKIELKITLEIHSGTTDE